MTHMKPLFKHTKWSRKQKVIKSHYYFLKNSFMLFAKNIDETMLRMTYIVWVLRIRTNITKNTFG